MIMHPEFEEIRPYNDSEVADAIGRLVQEKGFFKVISFFFPEYPTEKIIELLLSVKTVNEFQLKFATRLTAKIIKNNVKNFVVNGLDNLDKNKNYLIISNHRDIILDSALLNHTLLHSGYKTTEIAIGSNLLILKWIYDLVRLNKTFIVKRNLPRQEFYDYSILLSKYIRHTITEKKESIWIAQREGRTKNGLDKTQPGLLKMFNISGEASFEENFAELNIIPLAISYQYEPCDIEKVAENYNKMYNDNYKKSRTADLLSMGKGLISPKGNITYSFDKLINNDLEEFKNIVNRNEKLQKLAEHIDKKIYKKYEMTTFNYVAASEYFRTDKYNSMFTKEDKDKFDEYINDGLKQLDGDKNVLKKLFLEIYANPTESFFANFMPLNESNS